MQKPIAHLRRTRARNPVCHCRSRARSTGPSHRSGGSAISAGVAAHPDCTDLFAVTGDQVVAAVDLGVAFERNSQCADLPNQLCLRGPFAAWRQTPICLPDGRPALLDKISEDANVVGIRDRNQKA